MKHSRAQVSMEYILIISFSLLLAMPLVIIFLYNSSAFNTSVVNSQSGKVLQEIVGAAETVHYLGEPSQKIVSVYFPKSVQQVIFSDKYVAMVMNETGSTHYIYKYSNINFTGNITTYPGLHVLKIAAVNNTVSITPG
jgi:uncharacterized protein (UPF0333 family)